MKFLSQVESLKENGQPSALSENDIWNIIKIAKPKKNDIFYDLGSGYGALVRSFFTNTDVNHAVGLENDIKRFLISIEITRDDFSKKELGNINFWCTQFQDFNFSDATIIYCGLDEIDDPRHDSIQAKLFDDYFRKKKIKIIKRDFPLVGYRAIDAIRDRNGAWFFLMQTPLNNYKIYDKKEWIEHLFAKKNKTVKDLAKYFVNQKKKRGFNLSKTELALFRKNFERIAKKRFLS